MDYSLLVGVHTLGCDEVKREAMEITFVEDMTRQCYIGIVDILTNYGCMKRAETFFKSGLQCGGKAVSCQHPHLYGVRFLRFLEDHVLGTAPVQPTKMPPSLLEDSVSETSF